MPVSDKHPLYKLRINQYTKIRDFYYGEDRVKGAAETYLHRLKAQNKQDYDDYRRRALFFSIISKTVSAMIGLSTSKPESFEGEGPVKDFMMANGEMDLKELKKRLLIEMCLMTRGGILIDRPANQTVDEWPNIVIYQAEDIINWNDDKDDQFVVLRESTFEAKADDRFNLEEVIRYRVLTFEDTEEGPRYIQDLYDSDNDHIRTIRPTNRGQRLDYIPFIPMSHLGLNFKDSKPAMLDVANINHSHYMTGADLENGRHFVGLPTPIILNAEADKPLYLGSSELLVIPGRNADAKFLEFTGQGLKALETALADKERQMISLSAKALQESPNGSESSEAISLRFNAESASLRDIVDVVEAAINRTAMILADFQNEDPFKVIFDKRFVSHEITPDDAAKWFDLYMKGAISVEHLIQIYMAGEVYPDGTSYEEAARYIVANAKKSETDEPGE